MKRLISILAMIILTLCFTSCGIMLNNINRERTRLNVEIFQTLSSTAALAQTTDDYKVVMIQTDNERYYDGKTISGWFKLVDTYTYESKGNVIKTVPVYRRISELR